MTRKVGPALKAAEAFPVNVNALIPPMNMLVPTIHHVPCAPPRAKSLMFLFIFENNEPTTRRRIRYTPRVTYSRVMT